MVWAYFDFLHFPLSPAHRKMQTSCWHVLGRGEGVCVRTHVFGVCVYVWGYTRVCLGLCTVI